MILEWDGRDLVIEGTAKQGRKVGAMMSWLRAALEGECLSDAISEMPSALHQAFKNLGDAYSLIDPIFNVTDLPIGRRLAQAPEYAAVLSLVAVAEITFVTELARLRQRWLWQALHDGDLDEPEEEKS